MFKKNLPLQKSHTFPFRWQASTRAAPMTNARRYSARWSGSPRLFHRGAHSVFAGDDWRIISRGRSGQSHWDLGRLFRDAAAVGPLLGGWIVDHMTRQAIFLINPFLAFPAICIAVRQVPESYDPEAPPGVDWAGSLLAFVHLELPEDIAHEMAPAVPLVIPHPIETPVAQNAALDRAADLILRAERPLVMLGAAASRPKLTDALSPFVRRLRIPFFNTQMGKGAVAGGSGLYMGTAALSERDHVHQAIDRADLIISIGHDTVEKPHFFMGARGPKVLHVGYLPATVEEVYFPHAELIDDIFPSLALLADRLEGKLPRAGALLPLREQILGRIGDRAEESRYPLTLQRIVRDVRQVMPEDGIVCLDNGMYKIWFARNYRTRVANTVLLGARRACARHRRGAVHRPGAPHADAAPRLCARRQQAGAQRRLGSRDALARNWRAGRSGV